MRLNRRRLRARLRAQLRSHPHLPKPGRTVLPVALGALVLGAGTVGATAGTAEAVQVWAPLPLTTFSSMVVDDTVGRVFISGGSGSAGIAVTDLDTSSPRLLPVGAGATQLALSPDGATLYASVPDSNEILAIDTALTRITAQYPLGDGVRATSLAVAGGELWFAYTGSRRSGVGSLTADGTLTPNVQTSSFTSIDQVLVGTPTAGDELALYSSDGHLTTFRIAEGKLTALGVLYTPAWTGEPRVQFTADGQDVATDRARGWYVAAPAPRTSSTILPTLSPPATAPYAGTAVTSESTVAPDGSMRCAGFVSVGWCQ